MQLFQMDFVTCAFCLTSWVYAAVVVVIYGVGKTMSASDNDSLFVRMARWKQNKNYTGLLRELLRRKWQQAYSSEYTKTCMQGSIRGLKVLKDTKTLNNYDLSLTLLRDNSKIGKACARCTHMRPFKPFWNSFYNYLHLIPLRFSLIKSPQEWHLCYTCVYKYCVQVKKVRYDKQVFLPCTMSINFCRQICRMTKCRKSF